MSLRHKKKACHFASLLVTGFLCFYAALTSSQAASLIDDAFGEATTPVMTRAMTPSKQIAGVFPKGWMEDASWTQVSATCTPGQQDGVRFLRISTQDIKGRGRVDFCHLLPSINKATFYHLRLKMRTWNWNATPAIIGMRHTSPPWDFVWSATLPTSSNWSELDFRFELKPDESAPALFLSTACIGGKLDIAYLKLEEIPEADLRAQADANYPDHGPANLFRNSRFPLGLQSGWYIKREISDQEGSITPGPAFGGSWGNGTILAQADASNPGPTGSPALELKSVDGRGVTLSSEPFLPVYPFVGHSISFYAKGEGAWGCRVLVDGDGNGASDGMNSKQGLINQVAAELHFTPTTEWKRIQIPFYPHTIAEGYRLEFKGKTTLWIDGLQVGPTEKAGAYTSAGDCEVALGLPDSDASAARIQFTDEPAQALWYVTGKPAAGTLKFKVTNLYGEVTVLPDVPLSPALVGTRQTLDFSSALKERPYGAFRLETWVEANGKRISPLNELVVNRLHRPRYWGKDAPDSPFGIHVDAVARNILMAKAVGVNWVRLHDVPYTWWNFLEPEKGHWNFYDGEIALYRKLGMKLLGDLETAPKWASNYADTGKSTWNPNWDQFFQPKNPTDFANYVTTMATHYKGTIDDWDVWNEPWTYPFWSKSYDLKKPNGIEGYLPGPHAAADYAELMKTAYIAAHAANPTCNVLGFNTTGHADHDLYRYSGPEWTNGVLQAGGLNYCDTLCYHWYDSRKLGYPGDVVADAYHTALYPIQGATGKMPKPVWMTEGSSVSNIPTGFGLAKISAFGIEEDDYNQISDRVVRYMLSMSIQGVSKWFLYAMSQYTGRVTPTYVVLLTPDGYLHPSGVAHSAFAWLIEGTKFVRFREVAPGVYASLFRGGDRAAVVFSSRESDATFHLPLIAGAELLDLYGNPLPAGTPFTGKILYLSAQGEAANRLEATLAPKP